MGRQNVVIRGHQASHDFWGRQNNCTDNSRYAASYHYVWETSCFRQQALKYPFHRLVRMIMWITHKLSTSCCMSMNHDYDAKLNLTRAQNWRIASLVYISENQTEHWRKITFINRNKHLCRCSDIPFYKVRRQTRRRRYKCTGGLLHQLSSYDTWTDCRPTSRWKRPTLQVVTCKVLSSISCRHRHCYNTQRSNITDVYYRHIHFKFMSDLNWSLWNKFFVK